MMLTHQKLMIEGQSNQYVETRLTCPWQMRDVLSQPALRIILTIYRGRQVYQRFKVARCAKINSCSRVVIMSV